MSSDAIVILKNDHKKIRHLVRQFEAAGGQPVPLAAMTHEGVGKYVLKDEHGVYRHDEESFADFRDKQRVAVFEPHIEGEAS